MTTQLAPTPVFKAFDNNGLPLANGMLYSYIAGTTTPQATYTDSTGSTPNTNPVVLNARGEANVWLNPTQGYKLVLTDSLGNQIWSVDGIIGPVNINQSLLPAADNTYSLGSPSAAWAQLYLGANHAPALNGGIIGYWPQTAAELAAGVTPTNYAYEPGAVVRYGADPSGVNDSYPAFTSACSVWSNGGPAPIVRSGTFKFLTALAVPSALQLDLQGATVKPSGAVDAFALSNACGVRNGTIDLTATTGRGAYANAAQQVHLEDLYLSCSSGTGLELANCYSMRVRGVRFVGGSGMAINCYSNVAGTPVNSSVFEHVAIAGFTTAGDICVFSGVDGIWLQNWDVENNSNAAGSNDIHVLGNADAGVSQFRITDSYFETGNNIAGTSIYLGGASSTSCSGISIEGCYFQVSKKPVYVDANVADDLRTVANTFQANTGSPAYAVSTSQAAFYPNVHGNFGSLSDIDRAWTPAPTWGGATTGWSFTAAGRYQRVDNRIAVQIALTVTAKGTATGAFEVTLPKAPNSSAIDNAMPVTYLANMSGLQGATIARATGSGGATAYFYDNSATASVDLSDANFTATSEINCAGSYEI